MHQLQYRIRDGMESSKKVVFVLDCIFLEIFLLLVAGLGLCGISWAPFRLFNNFLRVMLSALPTTGILHLTKRY